MVSRWLGRGEFPDEDEVVATVRSRIKDRTPDDRGSDA
jgi:hypothetical protein